VVQHGGISRVLLYKWLQRTKLRPVNDVLPMLQLAIEHFYSYIIGPDVFEEIAG
jgi:hypothetical protein